MEEDKKKKKKLTISISSKRSSNFVNINRGNKKSVIIEKKFSRPGRGEKIFLIGVGIKINLDQNLEIGHNMIKIKHFQKVYQLIEARKLEE